MARNRASFGRNAQLTFVSSPFLGKHMTTPLTALKPLRPTLYRLANDGYSLDFIYVQCSACGRLTFPANAPGCMHCGDPLQDAAQVARPGGGTLLEYVTIHVPMVPGMAVPCIAGDIRLAEGIVEEGVIAVPNESGLHLGMELKAVATPGPSSDVYTCQFVPQAVKE